MRRFLVACLAVFCSASYHGEIGEISFTGVGSAGAAEVLYMGGFYQAPAADANLTQASASVNLGTANTAYGAHAFIVAGAAGAAAGGSGSVILRVTGTSITDAAVRTTTDTEDIVADITALATDEFAETTKKWIGQVTISLVCTGGCTHTTYSLDFNYGFSKYNDLINSNFTVTGGECTGKAKSSDSSFDIEFIHHKATGWTYHATAFVAGPAAVLKMSTDYSTESDLTAGEQFAWKRDFTPAQWVTINGNDSEGVMIRVTTGAANVVAFIVCEVHFRKSPYQD